MNTGDRVGCEDDNTLPIAGVVFAGGRSRRMGRIKALMPYGESTFLETVVEKMSRAGITPIIVVLTYHANEIIERTRLPRDMFVINHSRNFVRTGLEEIVKRAAHPSAILICPVDIPAIRVRSLRALAKSSVKRGASVMVPMQGRKLVATLAVISRQFLPWSLRLSLLFFRSNLLSSALLFFFVATLIILRQCRLKVLKTNDPGMLANINTPLDYLRLDQTKA
ncbi:MAG TPA: NTP transferase domain-containing protein [Blastocatellia bacterium]|nr:NTP transferase domain-containing protein [Blastocatellia bacterium]